MMMVSTTWIGDREDGGFGSGIDEGSKLDLDLKDLMGERRGSKLNQAIQGDVEGDSMEEKLSTINL